MIVAMLAVRMMQMAGDQIINVIAVRNRLMAAVGAVDMPLGMGTASVFRRAVVRVLRCHLERVLFDFAPLGMMQVSIVQVIDMVVVLDGGMAASFAVVVIVVMMMVAHFFAPLMGFCSGAEWEPFSISLA